MNRTDLPDVRPGTPWWDTFATQWRNLFDTVLRLANLQVGPGLRLEKRPNAYVLTRTDRDEKQRPAPRRVAIISVGEAVMQAREVRYVDAPPAPGSYAWHGAAFDCYPEPGGRFTDFASSVFVPGSGTDPPPIIDTPMFLAHYRQDCWFIGMALGGGDNFVQIRNDSGIDCAQNDILVVNVPTVLPTADLASFRNSPVLSCVKTTSVAQRGRFVVLAEPIKIGKTGRARLSGLAVVQIDVANTTHQYADVSPTFTGWLVSAAVGSAQILWKENGIGIKWALVTLGIWPAGTFPVTLIKDGGTQGTSMSAATWKYTIYDANGFRLASNVSPVNSPHKWRRPSAGVMLVATAGMAHYAIDGNLILNWINEVAEQEAC